MLRFGLEICVERLQASQHFHCFAFIVTRTAFFVRRLHPQGERGQLLRHVPAAASFESAQ
ncbi:hypothetical protein ABLN72_04660, partial [Mycobacterium tuberculosis]